MTRLLLLLAMALTLTGCASLRMECLDIDGTLMRCDELHDDIHHYLNVSGELLKLQAEGCMLMEDGALECWWFLADETL